jgi:CRISPR/Cas system-associated exonuclease Cas4 (RecB family)
MTTLRLVFVFVALVAIASAIAMPLVMRSLARQTGFTVDRSSNSAIIASDTGLAWILIVRDEEIGVCGKPDYVIEEEIRGRRLLVPVEVKPTRRSRRLYDSDRLQLGVYLLGLRALAGDGAADFGYVRYAAVGFEVRLTPELEREVRRIAQTIRLGRTADTLHRTHGIPARCRACAVRQNCDESLAD